MVDRRRFLLAFALLLLSLAALGQAAEEESGLRTWVDDTGKYKIEATFVRKSEGRVYLRREDGTTLTIPEARLSEADRKLATKLAEQAKAGESGNPFEVMRERPSEGKELTRAELVQQVQRSIVYISTRDNLGAPQGLGSGFVIDASGLVATNYHVIQAASSATAKFRDGTEVEIAGYRALDKAHDLAILQLKDPPANLKALRFNPDRKIEQGDAVLAFGHPAGFEFTVSDGIVSAVRKTAEMPEGVRAILGDEPDCVWIQISVPLVPGSSGGPLLDTSGNLLGINSWLIQGQSIAFAVHARHLAELIKKQGKSAEPFPVPGSTQGPGVSDPEVLAKLSAFRLDFTEFVRKMASVQDAKVRQEIAAKEDPTAEGIASLRALVEAKKGTKTAFEALVSIARLVQLSQNASLQLAGKETVDRYRKDLRAALDQIVADHVNEPSLAAFALELCDLATEEVHDFQRAVISRASSPQVQGLTTLALGLALNNNRRTAGRAEEESIACLERVVDEFGEVTIGQETLKSLAEPILMERKHLSIGQFPVEIAGKDSKGQGFKLSDYSGKVILLDFWADWCPYCRRMYPHERELLKKHSRNSFDILGINCEKLDRLKEVEAGDNVTWRSWADGVGGPIAQQWQVQGYPTVYLLDHQGRIRLSGNVESQQLDRFIDFLVNEKEMALSHNLVAPCSVWDYLETAESPGDTWRDLKFDDSKWNSGRGPFGFGLGVQATPVGLDPEVHTTYFRKRFVVPDANALKDPVLGLSFDDGVAVYLNGVELFRRHLPPDSAPNARATEEASEGIVPTYIVPPDNVLKTGENVLAVELHQFKPESKDLHFDLTLSSNVDLPPTLRDQYRQNTSNEAPGKD